MQLRDLASHSLGCITFSVIKNIKNCKGNEFATKINGKQ